MALTIRMWRAIRMSGCSPMPARRKATAHDVDSEPMQHATHTQHTEHATLTGRIEHVLGDSARTRQEIAVAVGYAGHDVLIAQALAQLVREGHAKRTPTGWQSPR
jgi:starvation-inducible outer membrane lipoprotein